MVKPSGIDRIWSLSSLREQRPPELSPRTELHAFFLEAHCNARESTGENRLESFQDNHNRAEPDRRRLPCANADGGPEDENGLRTAVAHSNRFRLLDMALIIRASGGRWMANTHQGHFPIRTRLRMDGRGSLPSRSIPPTRTAFMTWRETCGSGRATRIVQTTT